MIKSKTIYILIAFIAIVLGVYNLFFKTYDLNYEKFNSSKNDFRIQNNIPIIERYFVFDSTTIGEMNRYYSIDTSQVHIYKHINTLNINLSEHDAFKINKDTIITSHYYYKNDLRYFSDNYGNQDISFLDVKKIFKKNNILFPFNSLWNAQNHDKKK